MPQITLTQKQTKEFSAFIRKHKKDTFFMAKDHGAYIGVHSGNTETQEKIIHYFRGCDPKKDEDYYDTQLSMFGGDDFGEHLEVDFVHIVAANNLKLRVKVTASSIEMTGEH